MYKYQNLKIESLGSWVHVFLINDAWKTQVHVNMNVIKHKVVAGLGTGQFTGSGQFTLILTKIQWNKVWSTAVPNNSRHDDGTLHVEAGLMMVFPSKSYFGYKKTNHLIEVLVFVQIVYARKFASAWFQSNLNLMQILVDATKVQFDKNN